MTTARPAPDGAAIGGCDEAVATETLLNDVTFRMALGHFCSGITVVASLIDSTPVGLTCQSFFSLSLRPPLVAFAASKTSTSFPLVRAHGFFSINVLAAHQQEISAALARTGTEKWVGVEWQPGRFGQPILSGSLATLECKLEAVHEAGDHYLVVAGVQDLSFDERSQPLLYFRGEYREVAAVNSSVPPQRSSAGRDKLF